MTAVSIPGHVKIFFRKLSGHRRFEEADCEINALRSARSDDEGAVSARTIKARVPAVDGRARSFRRAGLI